MTRPTPETLAHRATPATVAAAAGAPAVVTVSPTPVTGAGSLVRSLEALGVEVAFGIPGGAILPAYDPLFDSKVRHILVRHEQGAGHAAEGYARSTGKPGVVLVTSGPGATKTTSHLTARMSTTTRTRVSKTVAEAHPSRAITSVRAV